MKKKALFAVGTADFNAVKAKLNGLDYEATQYGSRTFIVVRDSEKHVGDPIAYVTRVLGQAAAKACY